MANTDIISEAVIKGRMKIIEGLVADALNENISPKDILEKGLIEGMNTVGEKFKNNEYYIPQVLMSAKAMQKAMDVLKPRLAETGVELKGTVAIGTVKGDKHDIGKNLVSMMLEGNGFEIIDLGVDVAPEKYVEAAKNGADIIGMSALLTTTMPNMKEAVLAIKEAGCVSKIMIGGAPVTEDYAKEIGADAYAKDGADAVLKAKMLLGL